MQPGTVPEDLREPVEGRTVPPARRRRRGATALEYVFVASLIIAGLMVVIKELGLITTRSFKESAAQLPGAGAREKPSPPHGPSRRNR